MPSTPRLSSWPAADDRLGGLGAVRARRRYPPGRDGLPGTEGAFLPCGFWLVQALAAIGRPAAAAARLDQLVRLASPLGLLAEEMDPASGAHLGNYPQALSHAALVQASLALRDALPPAPEARDSSA